ncbi:uncharacterized protein LOC143037904 [Oratosquilla oratoria]|uniref:uncharacterized protein LOC143037904 n=1 Tax=Oratosquilla oratoria TaxID=337810 RepID=UPI003F777556
MELIGDWKLRRYGRCEIDKVSSKSSWKTVDSCENNILIFTVFKNGVMTVRDNTVVLEYHNLAKDRLKVLRRHDVLLFVVGGQQGGPRKWRIQVRQEKHLDTDAVTAAVACSRALAHFLPVTVVESEGDIPPVEWKTGKNEDTTNTTGSGSVPAGSNPVSSDAPAADTNSDPAPVGTDPRSSPTCANSNSPPADTDSGLPTVSTGSALSTADATSGATTAGVSTESAPPAGDAGSRSSATTSSSSTFLEEGEAAPWDDHPTTQLFVDGAVSLENVLEEVLKSDVLGIPEAYACGGLAGGRGLESVLRLCLADPTLPQLVGVVEQLMKGL